MTDIKLQEAEVVQPKAEDFAKRYQDLVKEMGFQVACFPQYIKRDDGSFSTVITYQVVQLPKEEK